MYLSLHVAFNKLSIRPKMDVHMALRSMLLPTMIPRSRTGSKGLSTFMHGTADYIASMTSSRINFRLILPMGNSHCI